MCTILLSVKPEYSSQILKGTKKYEFRRQVAKQRVDKILIYSSAPEMKVIALVKIKGVLSDTPLKLWKKTKRFAGISESKFMEYFTDKAVAYAYQLGVVESFNPPKNLSEYGIKAPPQSFVYIPK